MPNFIDISLGVHLHKGTEPEIQRFSIHLFQDVCFQQGGDEENRVGAGTETHLDIVEAEKKVFAENRQVRQRIFYSNQIGQRTAEMPFLGENADALKTGVGVSAGTMNDR